MAKTERCSSCDRPCDRSYKGALRRGWDDEGYLCEECAKQSATAQRFVLKFLVLPAVAIAGAIYVIRFVVHKLIPTLLGSSFSVETVANIQKYTGWTLIVLFVLLGLKIMLKPWRRIKLVWRIILMIVLPPLIILMLADGLFRLIGWMFSFLRKKK